MLTCPRLASAADAGAIARVHVAARTAAYRDLLPPDALASEDVEARRVLWVRRLGNADGRCWVIEEPAGPFGFAFTSPARDEDVGPQCAELIALYLAPEHHARGHGRRLVDHALDDLARRGFDEVVLWVADENVAATGFYAKIGFVVDTRQPVLPFGDTGLNKRRLRRQLGRAENSTRAD